MTNGYLIKNRKNWEIYNSVSQTYQPVNNTDNLPAGIKALSKGNKITALEPVIRADFHKLIPTHPSRPLPYTNSLAFYSFAAPLGFGSRALITAPPKTGKTTVLVDIVKALDTSKCKLIVLLIDERPEEVTDFQEIVQDKGLILASTFDEKPSKHLKLAQVALDRCKWLAANGEDVVLILDSLTRLTRAANNALPANGKIGSGGLIYDALHLPKQLLGMARQTKEAGSITVIASCLIQTGSKLDEVIFEEFKGTGNSELVLSRDLAQKGLYPAIDYTLSGTRRYELILGSNGAQAYQKLQRTMSSLDPISQYKLAHELIKKHKTFEQALMQIVLQ